MALLSSLNDLELFGIQVINMDGLLELLARFILNIAVTATIIGWLYYNKSKRRDYVFTFTLISTTIFLLIFLLGNEKLQVGMALGLFAIFGIVRYRTETIPIREMTYLFLVIGISVINGLAESVSYAELLVTNVLFIFIAWAMEGSSFMTTEGCKLVVYEKIALIAADKNEELIADLKQRTGLDITKVDVGHINFLKDVAFLKVYYKTNTKEINTVDQITKRSQFNG
ncbi:MAG: DUF4956 domain-containing protein [Paludibacteraceae bacterium]|nr:DUF4956 domain-containing protein [Paludibacteraceae bacterium]HOI27416.1 DUF4956 domain-containing protein [Paludibacteraceae bacterium]HOU69258.1 DUF4956 domain-containing protein [Paludibacteraceae bacterium]HQF51014.1 DUF4956 domain-containing protein [Paludibacteraceae bacterium]HQJ90753.1 DUF4956 domain-containing protein [Paludibacteraceae bacterium]